LESSFLGEPTNSSLIPAVRARELALMARSSIPDEIRRRAIESIARAVRLGHQEASVSLGDLQLDIRIPEEELDKLIKAVFDELSGAGYKVSWDDITYLLIRF